MSKSGGSKRLIFLLIGITMATTAYGLWLFNTQLGVGWYHDDGIYTITANAIADGRGPRLDYLPGAPYATKYPLFWPALLAGFLSLTGATLRDLTGPLVVAPNALLIPLALLAYATILSRSWRFPLIERSSGRRLRFCRARCRPVPCHELPKGRAISVGACSALSTRFRRARSSSSV